jgi:flagellar protein FlgJ
VRPAEAARVRRAARDFEAIFLGYLLKAARQAPGKGLGPKAPGRDVYRGLADDELARSISRGKGLGLSDLLARELIRTGYKNPSSRPGTQPMRAKETGSPVGGSQ